MVWVFVFSNEHKVAKATFSSQTKLFTFRTGCSRRRQHSQGRSSGHHDTSFTTPWFNSYLKFFFVRTTTRSSWSSRRRGHAFDTKRHALVRYMRAAIERVTYSRNWVIDKNGLQWLTSLANASNQLESLFSPRATFAIAINRARDLVNDPIAITQGLCCLGDGLR